MYNYFIGMPMFSNNQYGGEKPWSSAGVLNLFASASPLTSIASPHWYKCTQDMTDLLPLTSPQGDASPRLGTPGLVVMADGSWPRGCGFKPRHRILIECKQFASYNIEEKFENKGSQMRHTKRILKKPKKQSIWVYQ